MAINGAPPLLLFITGITDDASQGWATCWYCVKEPGFIPSTAKKDLKK